MTYRVVAPSDWSKLAEAGLKTVVDPMIYRCGEVFLGGAKAVGDPHARWSLLKANLHGIGMFFDRLILDAKLPVFNYGDTFDASLNFDQRILTRLNDHEPILFDVDVSYEAYHQVKSAALEEVQKLYDGQEQIDATLAQEILTELSVAEYSWSPGLGDLGHRLHFEHEQRLAAFFVGGLIFGGYAQQLGSDHILQPKRSRLFLAAALRAKSSAYTLEARLFDELKARASSRCEDLPWFPTFFPYLLSKADTPMSVMAEAIALRRSGEAADYRIWLNEVLSEWTRDGRISVSKVKDVRAIAQAVDRRLGTVPWAPKAELKVTVADALAVKPPGSIDVTPTLNALWGWSLASLPGRRYRKLLTRAVLEDHQYVELERRVETVWRAG